jgi:glycosyltransferase involved in cell wall biosynthesis
MRICIVSEHASVRFGGEAILPVHYFRLLRSRGIESWLVVHARTRSELEELFPRDLDRIRFIPDLWIHKWIFALSCGLPRRVSVATLGLLNQLITQFLQRRIVRQLIREHDVDVIHQPIPVAPRFPSAMFGLGVPVIIGPMNGGMEYPPAFRRSESRLTRAFVASAKLFADLGNALLPGKTRASVLLVANARTRCALPSGIRGQVLELVENGIDLDVWGGGASSDENESRRFVFVGRLVDWKAVDIAIRALARVRDAELEIIGDGPMMNTWRSLVCELGLERRVYFTGWLSQQECASHLRDSIALVLPSLYECGGAVVLEAMATGKPVIATRWGGPADYLDSSCGILVEPESYEGLVSGFAGGMQKLLDSPELAKSMGVAGRERATRNFNWQGKIDQVIRIYRALAEKSDIVHQPFGWTPPRASVSEQRGACLIDDDRTLGKEPPAPP